MRLHAALAAVLLVALPLAGCAQQDAPTPAASATPAASPAGATPTPATPAAPKPAYQAMGFDGATWPRLDGVTLTILDHGAFGAFEDAKKAFENLTGATVVHVEEDDSGSALRRATLEKGDPTFDVVYGIDNVLYAKAVAAGVFEPYKPLLAERIDPAYLFFDANGTWHATPVDHGYVGVNVDHAHPALANATVEDLSDVRDRASLFVTEDPRTSTPGLGFLLATIATYGETGGYTWKDYWRDLFANGVLVTSGWTEAYEQHFSGGYGVDYGGAGDKPIVTSYTESPAYEAYFGRPADKLATPIVAPKSTFHQIQTMAIAKGAKDAAAAQAWIEFALTDAFQELAAPGNAVYPVVRGVDVNATYGGHDPAPGSFEPAAFSAEELGANVDRWVREWVDLCEAADCA
ncbi:MAG TPA: thiamine ABC transporter substrate-binding protein [Candidatus Thermoplasmatota archaeon]|nr:thiamine ABC transporter substrate-binding protein [Candidatus Thermoplasmatota archaeon]